MASDVFCNVRLDQETGEIDQTVICLKSTSRTCYYEATHDNPTDRRPFRVSKSATEHISVQRELQINGVDLTVLNTQNFGPVAFLVPSLLFFPAWAAILAALCEASYHIWCHKSNKTVTKEQAILRSPFHLITSEFCAKCRTEKWMHKISKIQDRRSLRRNLIDPTFVKHVVR